MNKQEEQSTQVVVKKHGGISAVWLVPVIALVFGAWLIYKAVSERGTFITVEFDNASGIVVGKTEVRYKGLVAGVVRNVDVSDDLKSVIVEIEMVPSTRNMLTDKTLFWYVTADVSFEGISGLDTLLSGSYINVLPDLSGEGEKQREFVALREAPPLDQSIPGLHITVQTDTLGSLARKSPVTFKQITVGYVSGFKYLENSNTVDVSVFIEPEYAHLVKENSRFWNASGFEISGSLTSGVNVKTESLASIISGGIAFADAQYEAVMPPAQNGQKYQLYSDFQSAELGHEINLILNWDAGIDDGSTIRYQGITLGKVSHFTKIDPRTRKITAVAKINPRVVPYLTTETDFFVSSPEIDLGGVTNMHNMLMGSYINVRPSTRGTPKREFEVYNQKPAYKYSEPGLHLVLTTNDISSLKVGTGIFHKQQKVGSVQAIENIAQNKMLVHIHIEDKYQKYVSSDSRFWRASGFKLSGNMQKLEFNAQSMQAILAGGIGFDQGISEDKIAPDDGDTFKLYPEAIYAKQRVEFSLSLPSALGISDKTRLMLRGEEIGNVHTIEHRSEGVLLTAGVLPEFEYILRENSQFWLVKPHLSLSGITDTDALFGGTYINVNLGEGEPKNHFDVALAPQAKHIQSEGLQLTLSAERGNVVTPGTQISYRGIVVGEVDSAQLNEKGDGVITHITIYEEYRHLVNHQTRFFNASGVSISGGLGNLHVKTESVDSILRGGLSFYNPEQSDDVPLAEGEQFTLFQNYDYAMMAGKSIKIHFNDVAGLFTHQKIKYKNQQIGVVERVTFNEEEFGAVVYAYINDKKGHFARSGSQFWLATAKLGLVGSENVASILEGGHIGVIPGSGEPATSFTAKDFTPVVKEKPYGLNVTLASKQLGSVRVGNPVLYRQVKVGEVIGVDLSTTADQVLIYINIIDRYAPLVRASSKFWNTSGFKVDAGVFSGVTIDSESIETILSGGVAFATPDEATAEAQVSQGTLFDLQQALESTWHTWQPKIQLNE